MMSLFQIASLFILTTFLNLSSQSPVDIPKIEVVQSWQREFDESLGLVYGVRPCGGPGQFIQWRVEGCNTTNSPCQMPADEKLRRSVYEFIPSSNIDLLGMRIIMSVNGSEPQRVFEELLPNSEVVVGVQTIVSSASRVAKEVRGMVATAQGILFNAANGETEVCAEADFEFV